MAFSVNNYFCANFFDSAPFYSKRDSSYKKKIAYSGGRGSAPACFGRVCV